MPAFHTVSTPFPCDGPMAAATSTVLTRALAFRERAHRQARRILGCDHLAEDAVQEALLALHAEVAAPELPGPWLVRATVHRALHLRRTLQRRQRHEEEAGRSLPDACCDNPLHQAHFAELRERVLAAIGALPQEQRRVVELHVEDELDYAGIAEAIGRPIGTVRSRLHRARQALAETLPDFEEPEEPERHP